MAEGRSAVVRCWGENFYIFFPFVNCPFYITNCIFSDFYIEAIDMISNISHVLIIRQFMMFYSPLEQRVDRRHLLCLHQWMNEWELAIAMWTVDVTCENDSVMIVDDCLWVSVTVFAWPWHGYTEITVWYGEFFCKTDIWQPPPYRQNLLVLWLAQGSNSRGKNGKY